MRYLLFAGHNYYPGGGWDDFRGGSDSLTKIADKFNKCTLDWKHIVDLQTKKVIYTTDDVIPPEEGVCGC